MVMAIAYEEAKKTEYRTEHPGRTGGTTSIRFFGSRDNPDTNIPLAQINKMDPGLHSGTHYHIRDQFQVILDGKGTLGRHALAPCGVHFSRAYTPYGPLISDAGSGLTFFVMRAHPETGAQFIPEKLDVLNKVPNRQPWQITRKATFPTVQSAAADMMLQAIPGMSDEHGLACYTLSMKPDARGSAPDPAHGDGQYLVVMKGSLLHENKQLKAPALVFVYPKDGPFPLHAGSEGVDVLVLNFPRPLTPAPAVQKSADAAAGLKTWQCTLCSFVYDEAAGLPDEGIAPGTRWKDVPDSWSCPDCSASKADFKMIEVTN